MCVGPERKSGSLSMREGGRVWREGRGDAEWIRKGILVVLLFKMDRVKFG